MVPFELLRKRAFFPLFLTQFFGAFNDNAFKFAMLTLISYHLSTSQQQSEFYQALAGGVFILPFFLFSATAGQLADKYNKALIAQCIKLFEITLMFMGSLALYHGYIYLMLLTLFGMGLHSSFFGPIKYAILPDQLPPERLLNATAFVEASTFVAILLGTVFGTLSIGGTHTGSMYAIYLIMGAAIAGFISSLWILPTKSADGGLRLDYHLGRATSNMIKEVSAVPGILLVMLVISWFWLIGIVVLTKLPDFTNYVLRGASSVFTVFLTLFSIGIAAGSLVINSLLKGRITLRYVPFAMLLLSCFGIDLFFSAPLRGNDGPLLDAGLFFKDTQHLRIAFDLFFLAFSGGLFVVPLYTYLQLKSARLLRARTIAANNLMNALFMVIGSILLIVLAHTGWAITQVFLLLALINLLLAVGLWMFLKRLGPIARG